MSVVADKAERTVWPTTKHSNWFTSCQSTQVVLVYVMSKHPSCFGLHHVKAHKLFWFTSCQSTQVVLVYIMSKHTSCFGLRHVKAPKLFQGKNCIALSNLTWKAFESNPFFKTPPLSSTIYFSDILSTCMLKEYHKSWHVKKFLETITDNLQPGPLRYFTFLARALLNICFSNRNS